MNPAKREMQVSEEHRIRDLAQRLSEAEATIAALLSGQVDAVVDARSGTSVLLAKAQQALMDSEARYRLIVETTNEGVWLIDAGQKTTFMNRRMAEMLCCEADMGLGRSPSEFLDEAGRASFAAHVAQPGPREIEVRFVRADGTPLWALLEATPMLDSAGRYNGSLAMVRDITERRRAADALARSQKHLRRLIDGMGPSLFVGLLTPDGVLIEVNQAPLIAAGLTLDDVLGKPFADTHWWVHSPAIQQQLRDAIARAAQGESSRFDLRARGVGDEVIDVDFSIQPLRDETGNVVFLIPSASVISERKQIEAALQTSLEEISRINRALKMLSGCQEALIRMKREPELLDEICRIAVEIGGYRMAWIGYAQRDEARSVTPMAHAGAEENYFSEITFTWKEGDPLGRGPAAQAIRTGRPIVVDDLSESSAFSEWLPFARQRGYRSSISLPLRDATHAFGVLGLFSADVHQTSAEELRLLQQIADDLTFGIGNLRNQSERSRLDSQVREQAALLDIANEAIMVKDLDGRVVYWNKGAERTYGWSAAEALGRDADELLHTEVVGFQEARAILVTRGEWQGEEVRHAKGGEALVIDASWTLVRDEQGRPKSILAINTDITERKRAEADRARLNDEIQLQRLRVFKATMRTVQDIVNNLLNGLQLVHVEAQGLEPAEMQALVEEVIQEAAVKLKTLGDLETVKETEMEMGLGIDYPGASF
jgi:PAS domain S-box-containing protein